MALLYVEVRGVRSEFLVRSYSCKVVPVETIRVRVEDVKVPADVV